MSKKAKITVILVFLLVLGVTVFLVIANQPGFTGNRVANPDSYTLDIERMHGTDRHTMELNAGDVLQIQFETEKGTLHMEIIAPDGTLLYTGNGQDATEFTVNVPQIGVYSIVVEARHAKGIIQIQREEKQQ